MLNDKDVTRDQALGIYMGMAVGDALGAPWEFTKPDLFIDWKEIEIRTGGAHSVSEGEWTDDTAMARCIAHSYINFDELIPNVVYENFCAWEEGSDFGTRDYIFDIGVTCMTAIGNYKQGVAGELYRGVDDNSAQGNGGIMRLAPVILANINDITRCRLEAIQSSALTHASETCLLYADRLARDLFWGKYQGHSALVIPKQTKNTGHVIDTYFSAWQAVMTTGSFEDAIKKAVCRGGDSDTVAAVAGMIAGRIYGLSSIPDRWLDKLIMKDELLDEANALYTLGMTRA